MTSMIATIDSYIIKADQFVPGEIDVKSVQPAELDVQATTNLTVIFTTESVLYKGTNIKIEYPTNI